jgi:hypothetical protein
MQNLVGLKGIDLAVKGVFVTANLVREAALIELYAHAAGVEEVDSAGRGLLVAHPVQIPVAIAGEFKVREDRVLQLDAGHDLVRIVEQL